jgi:hypothetical protein
MTNNRQNGLANSRAARYMTHELAFSMGYVRTPGGFRHRSFVHLLKPGETISKREGTLRISNAATKSLLDLPAPTVPAQVFAGAGGGWVTWATWVNTTGAAISLFETAWVVPPAPTSDSSQLIYLFNALEDQAGDDILQPVLQWGVSGAGGGNYWGVASWYVDSSNHAFCTPVVPVNVGDKLVGVLSLDGLTNYKCEFQGISGTDLIAQGLSQLVQATETLEVYGLTKFTDYPNAPMTRMTDINVELASNLAPLNWSTNAMSNPAFGEHTTIVSNLNPGGEVDLCY